MDAVTDRPPHRLRVARPKRGRREGHFDFRIEEDLLTWAKGRAAALGLRGGLSAYVRDLLIADRQRVTNALERGGVE